jgi:hypothetical protein
MPWAVAAAFAQRLLPCLGLSAIDIGVEALVQPRLPEMIVGAFGSLYLAIVMRRLRRRTCCVVSGRWVAGRRL